MNIISVLNKTYEAINNLVDLVLPPRSNFSIVKNLNEEKIYLLPKAERVPELNWIYPLFQYHDKKVRAIIWELKYRENTLNLNIITKMMHDEILSVVSDILIFNSDAEFLLIPIPMTDKSKIERGYNQSELIVKSIIENDLERRLIYAPQWFRKIKETDKQSHSSAREERMKNLEDCFEANPNVEGKYVFLIDDVVTTGSTLKEARKTLLESSARDVFAFTIAH